MTLDESVELGPPCSAMLSREFWVLLKEVENQLTVICGNWHGVQLERAHTAPFSHTVWRSIQKAAKKKKDNYVYYFSRHKVSAIDPNWMASVRLKIWHSVM